MQRAMDAIRPVDAGLGCVATIRIVAFDQETHALYRRLLGGT